MASSPKLTALAVVLLCGATIMAAPAGADVVSYSYPVFDANTTRNLTVATNYSIFGASLLFQPPGIDVSEGFLLLDDTIDVWRAGASDVPSSEASFNTSFTMESSASPVSFAILLDRYPFNPLGLRGANDLNTGAVPNATADGLAAVEVGMVKSYAPEFPDVGLNVTITPNGTAAAVVWIQYDAVAHLLHVYVGAASGEPRPSEALLDARLSLAGQPNTQTAFVGFFAGTVHDILVGVHDWDLTVDKLDGKEE